VQLGARNLQDIDAMFDEARRLISHPLPLWDMKLKAVKMIEVPPSFSRLP
jgi:hypothetical protein